MKNISTLLATLILSNGAVYADEIIDANSNAPTGSKSVQKIVLAEANTVTAPAGTATDSTTTESTDTQKTQKKVDAVEATQAVDSSLTSIFSDSLSGNPVNSNLGVMSPAYGNDAFGVNPAGGRQPAAIKFGQISVVPTMGTRIGYNDNVTSRTTNKIHSPVFNFTPQIVASVDKGAHKYAATYSGDFYRYSNSSIDNRDTNSLILAGQNGFTTRLNLNWALSYIDGAEARGLRDDSRNAGANTPPSEYRSYIAKGLFVYGAPNAIGKVELTSSFTDKEYTNNRTITQSADYDSFSYGAEYVHRLAPKTQLTIGALQTQIDYKLSTSLQDSTETSYFAGARWKALAKTEGYFKIGRQYKDFDASSIADRSTNIYQVGAIWAPRTYSTVNLSVGKGFVDGSSALVSSGLSETVNASWTHGWKSYLRTTTYASYTNTDYITGRTDKTDRIGASILFDVNRNMSVSADYTFIDRDSSDSTFSYRNNLIFVGAYFSL
jgi:polysaccharide biosynthesis protein VpsM